VADVEITDLPASGGLAADDVFPVVDDPAGTPVTQKATLEQVSDFVKADISTDVPLDLSTAAAGDDGLTVGVTGEFNERIHIGPEKIVWSDGKRAPYQGSHVVGAVGNGQDAQIYIERVKNVASLVKLQSSRPGTLTSTEQPITATSGSFPMTLGSVTIADAADIPSTSATVNGIGRGRVVSPSVEDDFNRTDSAVTLGAPWTTTNGTTWGVSGDKAYNVAGTAERTVTNKELVGNVVTLTTSTPHGFVVGDRVLVSGMGSPFDSTYVVTTTPLTTTFTYARTASDVTSAPATGTVRLALNAALVETGSSEHRVTASFSGPSVDLAGSGLVLNYVDDQNYVFISWSNAFVTWEARKVVNGAESFLFNSGSLSQSNMTIQAYYRGQVLYVQFGANANWSTAITGITAGGTRCGLRGSAAGAGASARIDDFSVEASSTATWTGKTGNELTGFTCTTVIGTATTDWKVRHEDGGSANLIDVRDGFGAPILFLRTYGGMLVTDNIQMSGSLSPTVGLAFLNTFNRTGAGLVLYGDDPVSGTGNDARTGLFLRRVSAYTAALGGRLIIRPSDLTSDTSVGSSGSATNPHLSIGEQGTGLFFIDNAGTPEIHVAVDGVDQGLLQGDSLPVNIVAATGATETLAFDRVHDVTMDQNCVFSFTGAKPSGVESALTVIVRGAFTPTWTGVIWHGGVPPTYGSPSVYEFMSVDGGTTVFGFLGGASFA
jgi:hypothetical protein